MNKIVIIFNLIVLSDVGTWVNWMDYWVSAVFPHCQTWCISYAGRLVLVLSVGDTCQYLLDKDNANGNKREKKKRLCTVHMFWKKKEKNQGGKLRVVNATFADLKVETLLKMGNHLGESCSQNI